MKANFTIKNNLLSISIGMLKVDFNLNELEKTMNDIYSVINLFNPLDEFQYEMIESLKPAIRSYVSLYSMLESESTLILDTQTGVLEIKAVMCGQINIKDISSLVKQIKTNL